MIAKLLKRIHLPRWLEILLGIVFLLRVPSFFEPFYYGDEMVYLTLGNAIRHGLTLYKDIHDNKPPLLYLLAAVAGNVFWFKVLLAVAGIAAVILFWKLVSQIFTKPSKIIIATCTFAVLTTLPLLEGNIANAENFMIGFSLAGFLILLTRSQNFKNLFLAGVLFSLATLFKVPAAFEVPVIVVYWFIQSDGKQLGQLIRKTLYLASGFLVPIALTVVWFYLKGALPDYLRAVFLQNIGYLSSFRPGDVAKPFLVRNAPLLGRGAGVLIGIVILWLKRKRLSKEFLFATIWLLFTLFAVTLSERPYPHYLLQSVAPLAILVAILVKGETLDQVLTIIPIAILLFVPFFYKFYNYSSAAYYTRFIEFAAGKMSKDAYFNSFDRTTLNNYKISDFLVNSSAPTERIFVWGDSPAIYALTRRIPSFKYVAAYHILDFSSKKDVLGNIASQKPSFVVILDGSPDFPELTAFLNQNYVLISTDLGAQIWHSITRLQPK